MVRCPNCLRDVPNKEYCENCGFHLKTAILDLETRRKKKDYRKEETSKDGDLLYTAAHEAYSKGNYLEALENMKKIQEIPVTFYINLRAKSFSSEGTTLGLLARVYNETAIIYEALNSYEKALEEYEGAVRLYKEIFHSELKPVLGLTYDQMANAYYSTGNYEKACKYSEMAEKVYINAGSLKTYDLKRKYPYISEMDFMYPVMGHKPGEPMAIYEENLEKIKNSLALSNPTSLIFRYINIASIYNSIGYHQKALEYHEKGHKISIKIVGPTHAVNSMHYREIAYVHNSMGNYSRALDYMKKALKLASRTAGEVDERTGLLSIGHGYSGIGFVYYSMGEYNKAIKYYKKAKHIFEKGGLLPYTGVIHGNIGMAYHFMSDFKNAIKHYKKAINITENTGVQTILPWATACLYLSSIYSYMKDSKKTTDYYNKAVKALGQDHPYVKEASINLNMDGGPHEVILK